MRVVDQPPTGPVPMGPPAPDLQAMEAAWPIEAACTAKYPPPIALLPRTDGAPVLVLPGFTADDTATAYMRALLRWQGFWVSPTGLGLNFGPTQHTVEGLRKRLERLAAQHGQAVAVVGVSLGGVFARALAREFPELVSQVVTLGSPYRKLAIDQSTVEPIWNKVKHLHDGDLRPFDEAEENRSLLQVPAVSIYTRTDGVVPWELCVDATGAAGSNPRAENIEVYGTHTGMAHNASVIFAVTDRLTRLHDGWQPFAPPCAIQGWYPRAVERPPVRR